VIVDPRGSWAAAYRKVSCHATVAWHRRNIIRNNWTRDKVEQGTRGIGPLRKSLWTHHEVRMGVEDLGGRWLLYLRNEKTTTNSIGQWAQDSDHLWEAEEL
jgi:hypothetical protein